MVDNKPKDNPDTENIDDDEILAMLDAEEKSEDDNQLTR
jgi:hypothetical protein